MNEVSSSLNRLSKSKFRSQFHLNIDMIKYIDDKGFDKIRSHAVDFVEQKIGVYDANKDGKQTPFKNHPVFVAMHACACCCRGCLEKWYRIPKTRDLTQQEKEFIIKLLMTWIEKEYKNGKNKTVDTI